MELDPKVLAKKLNAYLFSLPSFREALRMVKRNSEGRIWLTGGGVSRSLAYLLYGTKPEKTDFDFIVDKIRLPYSLEGSWEVVTNKYGSPKFTKWGKRRSKELVIDMFPLKRIHSIIRRKLNPSIKNYLTGTPLTIQSLAYDIERNKLYGKVGLRSLAQQSIAVNNLEQFRYRAMLRGITGNEMLKKTAESMKFKAILPHEKSKR